jgi:hypothetical protein
VVALLVNKIPTAALVLPTTMELNITGSGVAVGGEGTAGGGDPGGPAKGGGGGGAVAVTI